MHQFIFGFAAVLCYSASIAVGLGDLGDDTTLTFRVKAVVGFLIPAVYFTWATVKERKRERTTFEIRIDKYKSNKKNL